MNRRNCKAYQTIGRLFTFFWGRFEPLGKRRKEFGASQRLRSNRASGRERVNAGMMAVSLQPRYEALTLWYMGSESRLTTNMIHNATSLPISSWHCCPSFPPDAGQIVEFANKNEVFHPKDAFVSGFPAHTHKMCHVQSACRPGALTRRSPA